MAAAVASEHDVSLLDCYLTVPRAPQREEPTDLRISWLHGLREEPGLEEAKAQWGRSPQVQKVALNQIALAMLEVITRRIGPQL